MFMSLHCIIKQHKSNLKTFSCCKVKSSTERPKYTEIKNGSCSYFRKDSLKCSCVNGRLFYHIASLLHCQPKSTSKNRVRRILYLTTEDDAPVSKNGSDFDKAGMKLQK